METIRSLTRKSAREAGPPGTTAAALLAKETLGDFPATNEALDNLYAAAAPVARYLADHWATTRDTIPSAPGPQ